MKAGISVYGIGFSIKRDITLEDGSTVRDALMQCVADEGREFDPAVFRNLTYLVNGKRSFENDAVADGDSICVLSVLGGG